MQGSLRARAVGTGWSLSGPNTLLISTCSLPSGSTFSKRIIPRARRLLESTANRLVFKCCECDAGDRAPERKILT